MKPAEPVVWPIDNLRQIAGHKVTVVGSPTVVEAAGGGKAVRFDGTKDGLVVESNPLAGWAAFTLEVVFLPEVGGPAEQRFFHCQADGSEDRRPCIRWGSGTRPRWCSTAARCATT
jgi:hypothetical protein